MQASTARADWPKHPYGHEQKAKAMYELQGSEESDLYLSREYPSTVSTPLPPRKDSPVSQYSTRTLEQARGPPNGLPNEVQVVVSPPPPPSNPFASPNDNQQQRYQQMYQREYEEQYPQESQRQQTNSFTPIVIPQIKPAHPVVFEYPFVRAYPPGLASRGISSDDFIDFMDKLNEAFIANPVLNIGFNVGNIMGMWYGVHGEMSVAGLILTNGCGIGIFSLSIIRTRALLKEANRDMFHPVGLHATVLNTRRMCMKIGYPEAKVKMLPKAWRDDIGASPSHTPGVLSPSPSPSYSSLHSPQQHGHHHHQQADTAASPFFRSRSHSDFSTKSAQFNPTRSPSPVPSYSSHPKPYETGGPSPPQQQLPFRPQPASPFSSYNDTFTKSADDERACQQAYQPHQTNQWPSPQQSPPPPPPPPMQSQQQQQTLQQSLQQMPPIASQHALSRRMEALTGYAQPLDFAVPTQDPGVQKNVVKRVNEWTAQKLSTRQEKKILRAQKKSDSSWAESVDRADEMRDDMGKKLSKLELDQAKAARRAAKRRRDGVDEWKVRQEQEKEEARLAEEARRIVADAEARIEKELERGKKRGGKADKKEEKFMGKVMWLCISEWTAEQQEEMAKKEREREDKRRRKAEKKAAAGKGGGDKAAGGGVVEEEDDEDHDDDFDAVIA